MNVVKMVNLKCPQVVALAAVVVSVRSVGASVVPVAVLIAAPVPPQHAIFPAL
jgi:hypothetical protein